MPWTARTFRERHNHDLSSGQAKKAAAQANAILRSGASEGVAIATANKFARKRKSDAERAASRYGTK